MSFKEKAKEKVAKIRKRVKKEKQPEVKVFEYGDLVLTCKCGRVQTIAPSVHGGLQFMLVTREDSYMQFHCDECGADLKLGFVEGVAPAEPVAATEPTNIEMKAPENESIPEESKEEQNL